MRAVELWRESVFSFRRDRWQTSLDRDQVHPSSRVPVQLAGGAYAALIRSHARGRLLDLGCGMVPCFGMYRDLVSSVTCVDWPNSFHASPHLDVLADLNRPLPLRDETFDTVLLTDVLEHIAYPDQLWSEIARVLKPGGEVIVGVPFMYWLHEQPHDFHRYTEYRLRMFCDDHGFTISSLSATGDARAVARDIALKAASRRFPDPVVRLLSRLAIHTLPTHEGLTAMPMGYALAARKKAG